MKLNGTELSRMPRTIVPVSLIFASVPVSSSERTGWASNSGMASIAAQKLSRILISLVDWPTLHAQLAPPSGQVSLCKCRASRTHRRSIARSDWITWQGVAYKHEINDRC